MRRPPSLSRLFLQQAVLLGGLWLGVWPSAAQVSPVPCTLPSGPLPTHTRAVFVLDTSGSMRGIGDGKADIFAKVKEGISSYVKRRQPSRIELVTFDSGVRSSRSYTLPKDAARFESDMAALRADGSNTHLYRSLQAALTPLSAGTQYLTNVFVLTDGIDNDPQRRATPQSALAAFKGRGPLDRLTYLALGTQIPREAVQALANSGYASGLTVPVGQMPPLDGLGTRRLAVIDPQQVPAPFADGTPLVLSSAVPELALTHAQAQGGLTQLHIPAGLPTGTPALLCAPPLSAPGWTSPRPRWVLLSVKVPSSPVSVSPVRPENGLSWLNPAAHRALNPGEEVVLRFRAPRSWPLSGNLAQLEGPRLLIPPGVSGLSAQFDRLTDSHELAIRLRNTQNGPSSTSAPQLVIPALSLPGGRQVELPGITLGSRQQPATLPPVYRDGHNVMDKALSTVAAPRRFPLRWLALLLGGGLLLGALVFFLRLRRATKPQPRPAASAPASGSTVPSVWGLQYDEDRTLALIGHAGEITSLTTPLGGPFDVGLLARVPHLSGVRVQQHRDGLQILHVPDDIDIRHHGRLLYSGDLVRPQTLMEVAVTAKARSTQPPMGSLVGLGLPLTLRTEGVTLQVCGPYGQHSLELSPGMTDLGEEFRAPALAGLKVSTSGPKILLADLPTSITITKAGETLPLKPGTYLPAESNLTLSPP